MLESIEAARASCVTITVVCLNASTESRIRWRISPLVFESPPLLEVPPLPEPEEESFEVPEDSEREELPPEDDFPRLSVL